MGLILFDDMCFIVCYRCYFCRLDLYVAYDNISYTNSCKNFIINPQRGRTYVILYLILAFWCLLRGLPLPIPPLNRIFRFSNPVSFKEI